MRFKSKLDYYIHMKFPSIKDFMEAYHAYALEHGLSTKANRNIVYFWRIKKNFPSGDARACLSGTLGIPMEELFPVEEVLNPKK